MSIVGILLFIYLIANIITIGAMGYIIEDIDELSDVKVKHLVIGVVFLPATIVAFVVICIVVGVMLIVDFLKETNAFDFMDKPLFKEKKEEEKSE
jgi:cbb3-type cytochrome oxidase subunit 1